jgi:hypothetical protein
MDLGSWFVSFQTEGAEKTENAIGNVGKKFAELGATSLENLKGHIDGVKDRIIETLNPLRMFTEALAAIGAGVGLGEIVSLGARIESVRATFDQLTRSAGATDELLEKLDKQFYGTSISTDQYRAAAKKLLSEGVAADEIPLRLKAIGNISEATGASLEGMAHAMYQAELSGKVTTHTLMMMPAVVEELKRMYPELGENIMQAAQQGKIGINQLQVAVDNLGGDQGKFGGAMAGQQAGLLGQWRIAKKKLEDIFQDLGEGIIKGFNLPAVVGTISGWLDWFKTTYGATIEGVFASIGNVAKTIFDWIGEHKEIVQSIAAIAAAMVAVSVAGPAIAAVFGTLAVLVSPIGLIAGALAGIAYLVVNAFGIDAIEAWATSVGEAIYNSDLFQETLKALAVVWDWIKAAASAAWSWLGDMATAIVQSKTFAAYLEYLNSLWSLTGDIATAAWQIIVAGSTAAWDACKGIASAIYEVLDSMFGLSGASAETFDNMAASAINFVTNGIKHIAFYVRNWDLSLQLIWENIKLTFSNCFEIVKTWGTNAVIIIKWFVDNFFDIMKTIGDFTVAVFSNLAFNVEEGFRVAVAWIVSEGVPMFWDALKKLGALYVNVGKYIWETLTTVFKAIGNYISGIWDNLIAGIKNAWTAFKNWLSGSGKTDAEKKQIEEGVKKELVLNPMTLTERIEKKDYAPHFKNLTDGFKSSIKEMPKLEVANTQQTNAKIEELHAQLRERMAAEDAKNPPGKPAPGKPGAPGTKEDDLAKRNAMIKGGAGNAPPPALLPGSKAPVASFVSLAGLAEKLQGEADKANTAKKQLDAQHLANKHLGVIAGAVAKGGKPGGKFAFWGQDESN